MVLRGEVDLTTVHVNKRRPERGLRRLVGEKWVAERKINRHLPGRVDAFEPYREWKVKTGQHLPIYVILPKINIRPLH